VLVARQISPEVQKFQLKFSDTVCDLKNVAITMYVLIPTSATDLALR